GDSSKCTINWAFGQHAIMLYDGDSNTEINLSTPLASASGGGLDVSADYFVNEVQFIDNGKQIAILVEDVTTRSGDQPTAYTPRLFVINADGTNARRITLPASIGATATWDSFLVYDCEATSPPAMLVYGIIAWALARLSARRRRSR